MRFAKIKVFKYVTVGNLIKTCTYVKYRRKIFVQTNAKLLLMVPPVYLSTQTRTTHTVKACLSISFQNFNHVNQNKPYSGQLDKY